VAIEVDVRLLIGDLINGTDDGVETWYADPNYIGDLDSGKVMGTFRSRKCAKFADVGIFIDSMCAACRSIPKFQSFRKRALLRNKRCNEDAKRSTTNIRNEYLNRDELIAKSSDQAETIEERLRTFLPPIQGAEIKTP
jgi:hypothetical protein